MSDIPTVLVIDDIETNLFMLSTMLKREGFSVFIADSGPAGREIARKERPDVILLDIVMPEESGYQTCELLKADPELAAIPVIFLSALEDTESKVKGLSIGAADYVSKPFMKDEILLRLRSRIRLSEHDRMISRAFSAPSVADAPAADDDDAFVTARASIAPGIEGFLWMRFNGRAPESASIMRLARNSFGKLATPLYAPHETVGLLSRSLAYARGDVVPADAVYCVLNRNASRVSVITAGDSQTYLVESSGRLERIGQTNDRLGEREASYFHAEERSAKQGFRICAVLGVRTIEARGSVTVVDFVSSTATYEFEEQRRELEVFAGHRGDAGIFLVQV